jgi:hypothetical protein
MDFFPVLQGELAGADGVHPAGQARGRTRRHALRQNRQLLLRTPPPPTLRPVQNFPAQLRAGTGSMITQARLVDKIKRAGLDRNTVLPPVGDPRPASMAVPSRPGEDRYS